MCSDVTNKLKHCTNSSCVCVCVCVSQAIVDTGKTLQTLLTHVRAFKPKLIKVAG